MKKLILSLSLFLTVASFTAAAGDPDPVTEEVNASFKIEFPGAQTVTWESFDEYLRATFVFGGFRTEAYFSTTGELYGSARTILYSQVPLAVTKAIEKRFTGPEVLQVNEITNSNGTSYIFRLDARQKRYKIQMDAGGNVINVEKQKK